MNNSNVAKLKNKKAANNPTIRVSEDTQRKAIQLLAITNKKKFGRKVKIDMLLNFALGLVTEEDIKQLQNDSLVPSHRDGPG